MTFPVPSLRVRGGRRAGRGASGYDVSSPSIHFRIGSA